MAITGAGPTNEEHTPSVNPMDLLTPEKVWEGKMKELENLKLMGVFQVAPRPPGPVIGTRWVLKPKPSEETGELECRARVVAQDFAESKDFDNEYYASTPASTSIKIQLSKTSGDIQLAPGKQHCVQIWDVSVAFLHADTKEDEDDIFVEPPPEMNLPGDQVLKCKKGLYGLRKAPRLWQEKATQDLLSAGLSQSKTDGSVFFNNTTKVCVTVHVDDYCVTGPKSELATLFTKLQKTQRIRKTGELLRPGEQVKLLGRTITRTTKGFLWESAPGYIKEVMREAGIKDNSKPAPTPAPPNMTSKEVDAAIGGDKPLTTEEHRGYRRLLGKLQWLSLDRPDISFACKELSRALVSPTQRDWSAAKRAVRYLAAHPQLLIVIEMELQGKSYPA
jgi:hypothetical protein